MRTSERSSELARDLELLRYFRRQLGALSDDKTLELFRTFESSPFTNGRARPLLGTSRQAAWERLSKLVELGLLEKRGHLYGVSPYAKALVSASSRALRSLLTNKVLAENRSAAKELVSLATQGLELMYAKGMVQPVEQARYQRLLAGIAREMDEPVGQSVG